MWSCYNNYLMRALKNKKSHYACLWCHKFTELLLVNNWQLQVSFLLKIIIRLKRTFDSLLFKEKIAEIALEHLKNVRFQDSGQWDQQSYVWHVPILFIPTFAVKSVAVNKIWFILRLTDQNLSTNGIGLWES